MAIEFEVENIEMPSINEGEVKKWIESVVAKQKREVGELTYIFCSDDKILEINKEYLQHDYYTDIITFDYTDGDILSGDMFISLDTVKTNSEKFETNYNEELLRVIIHGVLHLCGINDKTDEEEKNMRILENEALKEMIK